MHFIVFKQTASHIPHEANVEQVAAPPQPRATTPRTSVATRAAACATAPCTVQVFSRAGAISHPSMKPHKLGILVMVAINKKNFKPSLKDVKERYYLKFRSAAKDKPSASSDPGPSLQG